jgi:hypothetical protein
MKTWRSKDGNVWHRGPTQGSVTIHSEWVLQCNDGAGLEWVAIPGQMLKPQDRENALLAIQQLWPTSTKARLWRRVARLAGQYLFVKGGDLGFRANRVTEADSEVEAVKELIVCLREVRRNKRANKLEAALKAWEAVK